MKKYIKTLLYSWSIMMLLISISCTEDILLEKPLDFLNSDVVLINPNGFESAIVALHQGARDEHFKKDGWATNSLVWLGTDFCQNYEPVITDHRDYNVTFVPTYEGVDHFWEWAYLQMIPRANSIIHYADRPEAEFDSEEQKNAFIAEAKFFRAYTYNTIANLYGGVPIVEEIMTSPKLDFVRNTREEVLEFAKADLEFASKWLPETTKFDGRIVKAAADHLLSEVNISLGNYDAAITNASDVINSGLYELMTERFGSRKDEPGDVFWDMFRDGNQNRSSGNRESIWVWQFEFETPGGTPGAGGNDWIRMWGARYYMLEDPNGENGMVLTDSIGRGVGWWAQNNYSKYTVWKDDWNDMRNSNYNIRRQWYYNNPDSEYFMQPVEPRTSYTDTTYVLHPNITKIEGSSYGFPNRGKTFTDVMRFRLAETYLLRAEAYLMKGDQGNAAADINVVRARAKALPVDPGSVDIDYILDERMRELVIEENRRQTLVRTNTLVRRVKKYNEEEITRTSIQDYHRWLPIPQKAIDANLDAVLEQNPGYPN